MSILDPSISRTDDFGNTLTLKESGQTRAYGDSRWSGTVHCRHDSLNHEDMVKAVVQGAVKEGYIFPKDVERPFYCPVYERLEQSSSDPHLWHFVVTRVYLD